MPPSVNVVNTQGVAIAPAFAFGLDTPTRVYVYSQHVRQNNVPDGGIPTIGMEGFYNANATIQAGAKVSAENFYGSKQDYEKVEADMFTAKVEHESKRQ
jgi:catecholate siderophore receptor